MKITKYLKYFSVLTALSFVPLMTTSCSSSGSKYDNLSFLSAYEFSSLDDTNQLISISKKFLPMSQKKDISSTELDNYKILSSDPKWYYEFIYSLANATYEWIDQKQIKNFDIATQFQEQTKNSYQISVNVTYDDTNKFTMIYELSDSNPVIAENDQSKIKLNFNQTSGSENWSLSGWYSYMYQNINIKEINIF